LGGRKGIRPVKTKWWGAGVVICLERGADLHMEQLMPLPLTVSCFSKIKIGFCSPGKRLLNVCVVDKSAAKTVDPSYNKRQTCRVARGCVADIRQWRSVGSTRRD